MTFLQVGPNPNNMVDVPAPTSYSYGLQDISAAEAGRVQDEGNTMHKMRTSQKRKMALSWSDLDGGAVSHILQAFNEEYVYVRYLDALTNSYEVREFYTGDKSAPLRCVTVGGATYTTLSFDIIER